MAPPRKLQEPAAGPRIFQPVTDASPQVMVTREHALPDVVRFAETIYASVMASRTPHIDWSRVAVDVGIDAAECKRLWRFIAYHWKGPYGRKRPLVDFDHVDLDAESDVEGAVTHAVPVSVKGKYKKKGTPSNRPGLPGPVLGFTLFCKTARKGILAVTPDISFGDIAKKMGKMWKELPNEERARYIEDASKQSAKAKAPVESECTTAQAQHAATPSPQQVPDKA